MDNQQASIIQHNNISTNHEISKEDLENEEEKREKEQKTRTKKLNEIYNNIFQV